MCCLENEDYLEDFNDEFYDDELIEKPSKSKKTKVSSFDTLKKYFDTIEVEEKELYDLFICKNKANNTKAGFIKYETWLCVKIRKNNKEDFAKEVLTYIDKLINNDKTNVIQLTLFDEIKEKSNKISIDDLSFWDCINNYYFFDYDDYLKDIPQTNEEMMDFVKKCISLYFENQEKKYDFFEFDDDNRYMTSEPISDREMLSRLYSCLRIYFGVSTYVENRFMVDLSGGIFETTSKGDIRRRFCTSYYGARLKLELYGNEVKFYDLYNKEFCNWLREKLNVPYREPLADNEVIKQTFLSYSRNFFKDENELYFYIKSSKNAVDFRKSIVSFIKENKESGHMGSGGGPLDDCYSYSYGYDINHLELSITQLNEYRNQLGRVIIKHEDGWKDDFTYILNIHGNEVFESMYKYLSDKPSFVQATLF